MFGLSAVRTVIFGAVAIAAIGLLGKGIFFVTGMVAENKNLIKSVSEYREQKTALEVQAKSDKAVINGLRQSQIIMGQAVTITNTQFSEIRDQREREQRVLEASRLGRLAAREAQKIEELSNRGTQRILTQLEGVINEDI